MTTSIRHFIMNELSLLFLVLSVSFIFIPSVSGSNDTTRTTARVGKQFDYFVLSLEWPCTICRDTHYCCPTNACCRGISSPLHFTIHGLWPDYNDGTWPQCCSGPRFDERKIFSLLGRLESDWPSLSCSSPTDCHGRRGSFWAHEWEKHGTCTYPVIKDEYHYFSKTLQLKAKYNIMDILSAAGFSPSNDHAFLTRDLVAAIQKAIGAMPLLSCSHGQLEELHLCFYKDFKPRDCIATYMENELHKSSCPHHVMIPQYDSSGIEFM